MGAKFFNVFHSFYCETRSLVVVRHILTFGLHWIMVRMSSSVTNSFTYLSYEVRTLGSDPVSRRVLKVVLKVFKDE